MAETFAIRIETRRWSIECLPQFLEGITRWAILISYLVFLDAVFEFHSLCPTLVQISLSLNLSLPYLFGCSQMLQQYRVQHLHS
jgi:hypothetical protein